MSLTLKLVLGESGNWSVDDAAGKAAAAGTSNKPQAIPDVKSEDSVKKAAPSASVKADAENSLLGKLTEMIRMVEGADTKGVLAKRFLTRERFPGLLKPQVEFSESLQDIRTKVAGSIISSELEVKTRLVGLMRMACGSFRPDAPECTSLRSILKHFATDLSRTGGNFSLGTQGEGERKRKYTKSGLYRKDRYTGKFLMSSMQRQTVLDALQSGVAPDGETLKLLQGMYDWKGDFMTLIHALAERPEGLTRSVPLVYWRSGASPEAISSGSQGFASLYSHGPKQHNEEYVPHACPSHALLHNKRRKVRRNEPARSVLMPECGRTVAMVVSDAISDLQSGLVVPEADRDSYLSSVTSFLRDTMPAAQLACFHAELLSNIKASWQGDDAEILLRRHLHQWQKAGGPVAQNEEKKSIDALLHRILPACADRISKFVNEQL